LRIEDRGLRVEDGGFMIQISSFVLESLGCRNESLRFQGLGGGVESLLFRIEGL